MKIFRNLWITLTLVAITTILLFYVPFMPLIVVYEEYGYNNVKQPNTIIFRNSYLKTFPDYFVLQNKLYLLKQKTWSTLLLTTFVSNISISDEDKMNILSMFKKNEIGEVDISRYHLYKALPNN